MGVLGLTSFVREHERTLGKTVTRSLNTLPSTPLVVDGWSFIYYLAHSVQLPWVHGGEYMLFSQAVTRAVQAFLDVGFHLHFVFDGALLPSKFNTRIKRSIQNYVVPTQLFFRTSPYARSSPRFLAENQVQPAFYYLATLESLEALRNEGKGVALYFADDDADKFAVELAGQLGAYCLSNDSDYMILNCEGYKGYIMFDDLKWILPSPEPHTPLSLASPTPTSEGSTVDFDDLGFKTVTKSKSRRRPVRMECVYGLIPPEKLASLSFRAFHPVDLATQLKLPVALLPLIASLIGNDFSDQTDFNASSRTGLSSAPNRLFFESRLPASQRVTRVADVLRTILHPPKRKATTPVNLTGMELINTAVEKLLLRPDLVNAPQREKVVDGIVDSILRYAVIPCSEEEGKERVCPVHDAESCPLYLLDAVPNQESEPQPQAEAQANSDSTISEKLRVRDAYISAYRRGHLLPGLLTLVGSGAFWPVLILEDPDRETCQTSLGRSIREWVYALVNESVGIGRIDEEATAGAGVGNQNSGAEEEDEEELINVVEESSEEEELLETEEVYEDGVSSDQLHESLSHVTLEEKGITFEEPSVDEPESPSVVTEYVRRGMRVTDVAVEVLSLTDLISSVPTYNQQSEDKMLPQLLPKGERIALFQGVMQSPALSQAIPKSYLIYIACIRWVVRSMGTRANSEERWTKRDAKCLLASVFPSAADADDTPVELVNRSIQLTAQFLTTFWNAVLLVQTLLLTKEIPTSVLSISGKTFHRLLQVSAQGRISDTEALGLDRMQEETRQVFDLCWKACEEGLDEFWGVERAGKAKRKERKQAQAQIKSGDKTTSSKGKTNGAGGSLFSLLADMDGDS